MQRSHQQAFETLPQLLFFTLVASAAFPLAAAGIVALWIWGRLAWTHPDEHGVFYNASRTSVWLVNYGDADVAAQNVSVWGMGCGWAGALPAPRRATRRG